jgi:hypothetical protein
MSENLIDPKDESIGDPEQNIIPLDPLPNGLDAVFLGPIMFDMQGGDDGSGD